MKDHVAFSPPPSLVTCHLLLDTCRRWTLLPVLLCLTAPMSLHAQSASGVIEGRVFSAASGGALVNARITLDGTGREIITDESGSYRFAGVPAGTVRLSVSYLGTEPQVVPVNVPAGGLVQRDVEL